MNNHRSQSTAITGLLSALLSQTLQSKLSQSIQRLMQSGGAVSPHVSSARSTAHLQQPFSNGFDSRNSAAAASQSFAPNRKASPLQQALMWTMDRRAAWQAESEGSTWYRRGWGNRAGGRKRWAITRAARLKTIAEQRLSAASRELRVSTANRGKAGWSAEAHRKKSAAVKSARGRLGQAIALQARATSLGAAAFPPAAMVSTLVDIARLPWQLQTWNNSQREGARYSGQLSDAYSRHDLKTENLKALNAQGAAGSTSFLIGQQNGFRPRMQPYTSRLESGWNNAQGWVTGLANTQVDHVQNQANCGGAILAEHEQAAMQMRFPSMTNVQQIKKQVDEMIERATPFQPQFADTSAAWVRAIHHKREARWNNQPKPPVEKL